MSNCLHCGVILSERAIYCSNCCNQAKCKNCKELLEPNSSICVVCGEEVSASRPASHMNTIEYTETKNNRSFKASFTDTVGNNIGEAFGSILTTKLISKPNKFNTTLGVQDITPTTDNNEQSENTPDVPTPVAPEV